MEETVLTTVAQERLSGQQHQQQHQQAFKKRVVFSDKRYTSDDLANGRVPQHAQHAQHAQLAQQHQAASEGGVGVGGATPVGILKRSPSTTPGRQRKARQVRRAPRKQALHASFAEERAGGDASSSSPWRSASSSILAALALAVSPLARQRARQAERVARQDETVRRVVHFYKSSGEWWNVFPKTDYTYSRYSAYHREISPGVMTVPNMSRPSLHNSFLSRGGLFSSDLEHTPLRRPSINDEFSSDCDEVDQSRAAFTSIKRSLIRQQESSSTWLRIRNFFWTLLTTILTILFSPVVYIAKHGSRTIHEWQKPEHARIRSYYSYRHQQKSVLSRLWSPFHWLFSKAYMLFSHTIVRATLLLHTLRPPWRFQTTASQKKRNVWILVLLAPLLILLGWWLLDDDSLSNVTQKIPRVLEHANNMLWTCLTSPISAVQYLLSQFGTMIYTVISAPFKLLPTYESFSTLICDICMSPLWLFWSIWDIFLSFGWSVISLVQMLSTSISSIQVNKFEASTESVFSKTSNEDLKAMMDAALLKQEASLLSKMAEQEESLRAAFVSTMSQQEENLNAKLASKKEFEQKLNAKVLYLQDELRHLRRRMLTCCRRSEADHLLVNKEKLHKELKQLLLSPEGLILLGAAAAHTNSLEKTIPNIPQFNDTEIRAWISSAFLEKDDFERALENMTRYFNEELERRSAMMMTASTEEINSIIASQMQFHLNQMYKLRSELAGSNRFQSDNLQTGASFSSSETAAALDESRVRRIVDTALALYDADKTGMADYALESQGGQVISTRCTETYQVKSPTLSVFGVPLWYPSNSPRTVIQPGMHPGECWAFVGSQGFLVIELSHRIRVKGFTYEHISPVLLPTGKMDSAPKEFSVYGLRAEGDNEPILLGNYHYLENGTSMQYFPVQRLRTQPLQLIEIQVKSNHGNINYTCMYRFRVHGSIA